MKPSTLIARDIYVKRTDPTGHKKPVVTQHRVWDADLFMAAQVAQHDGEKTKPEDRRLVTIASRDEYLQANKH